MHTVSAANGSASTVMTATPVNVPSQPYHPLMMALPPSVSASSEGLAVLSQRMRFRIRERYVWPGNVGWMSVRLKLTLSYAAFLMLAGTLLLAAVWLFLLRYVPERAVLVVPNGTG